MREGRVHGLLMYSAAWHTAWLLLSARLTLAVILALALTSCTATREPAPLKRVVVAATNLPASAPVYVAHEKEFFRDEGLDVVLQQYGAGRLGLDAMLEGEADLATVADAPIARAVVDGKKPTIVATIAEIDDASVIVARKDRGIATARDLIGKRVGVVAGTSADFFLHIYLVTSAIEQSQISVVPVQPENLVAALTEGRVDAISAFDPYKIDAERGLGGNAVVLDDPGLYTTFWNVAARPEFVREDRDTTVRFLRALARANEYILANPDETQLITARHIDLPKSDLAKQWADNHWTLELSQPLILTLEDEARWMTGESTTPNFLLNIDPSALRTVNPEGVTIVESKD